MDTALSIGANHGKDITGQRHKYRTRCDRNSRGVNLRDT